MHMTDFIKENSDKLKLEISSHANKVNHKPQNQNPQNLSLYNGSCDVTWSYRLLTTFLIQLCGNDTYLGTNMVSPLICTTCRGLHWSG